MIEEIKDDNTCIVKAFENNPISILNEEKENKKIYYFKASDIGKALNLTNIAVSIQNYDEDERVIRKAYDTSNREQDTIFLSSQGVYRLLYNSKKPLAKKFRKWAGMILDDIIFNESKDLKKQLEEQEKKLEETKKLLEKEKRENALIKNRRWSNVSLCETIYVYKDNTQDNNSQIKIGKSKDLSQREREYSNLNKSGAIVYYRKVLNCTLAERVCHHILDKYRINRQQEWFNISEDVAKDTIDMVASFLDSSMENLPQFIELHKQLELNEINTVESIQENNNEIYDETNETEVEDMTKKSFQDFLDEVCSIRESNYVFKDELRMAFRIWSKSTDKQYVNDFMTFINDKFASGVEFEDTVRKNVIRGFSLNPLVYKPKNQDNKLSYEEFILSKCEIGWRKRISYADFFNNYTNWMKETDSNFTLTLKFKKEIQDYLEKNFAGGRVYLSQYTKTTHLFGIWGLSLKGENGLGTKKLTRKRVAKCLTKDDTVIQTWESLSIACLALNIPRSTLSINIRFKKLFDDGYYYKFV